MARQYGMRRAGLVLALLALTSFEVGAQTPDALRESFRVRLAGSVAARSARAETEQLAAARGIAEMYVHDWQDSILLRQLTRFERWNARDRATKVTADSLRRAGFDLFPRSGAAAAIPLWRSSLRKATSIADSAGLAATSGNLGAAYLVEGELDSAAYHLTRAQLLAERVRDWRVLGNTLGAIGSLEKARGNLSASSAAYRRALAARSRSGDDRGASADENNLGLVARAGGDTVGSRRWFETALARNRRAARYGAAAVNLANLAELAVADGRLARASALYRDALALHRHASEEPGAALDLRSIGGLALRQGEYRAAVAALTEAAGILIRTGPADEAAGAQADLAEAYAALGDLGRASAVLDSAEAGAPKAGPGALALLTLVRGDLAEDANSPAAAQAGYARAESLYADAGDAAGVVAARQGLGALQLRRGDYDGAGRTLQSAIAAQRASGDRRGAALSELLLGHTELEQGDPGGAAITLRRARGVLRHLADPVGEASALAGLGELAERGERPREAEKSYRQGLALLAHLPAPAVSVRLHWGLGRTLQARGALTEAAAEFQLALDAVERMAGGMPRGGSRTSLLGDTGEIYAALALVEHARGRDGAAFQASERLRAREMRELVARGPIAPPRGLDPAIAAEARELHRRIDELERGASAAPPRSALMRDVTENAGEPARRLALGRAQRTYADLLDKLNRTSPAYTELLAASVVSHRDVASRLRRDEALLEYLVTDGSTLLFVVTHDSTRVVPIAITRRELAAAIDFARAAIARRPGAASRQPWGPAMRRLHRLLIRPAEQTGLLLKARTLLIAPHAELHYLPFAALMPDSGTHYLVERYDLAYVPSAAIWTQLGTRAQTPGSDKLLVVAPFPTSLPGSRDEADRIRRIYGRDATMILGANATERAFRDDASAYSIIHLATYGVLNRHNPLFSYVAFAPDAIGSGRLEVQEVFGLSLRARLLVLSACETGLSSGAGSDVPPGDDWVGLVRAFLFAGADNVMATLWPIEDRATSKLLPQFYDHLRGGAPAPALALAQRQALRDPSTADPRYWAAFVLVGAVR